ncbi:MAG: hypothetical protein FWC19_01045 [Treponema sp.]|nr:hypothetical protein [Treponema sp.]MCL2271379.1 hypothetical protein [Treponema sp.]
MTDENENIERPNTNYKLSKPYNENSDETIVYHYSREHRLASAPQAVKDLYKEDKNDSKFNLLKPLIADKPRAMLFASIIILCVIIIAVSYLGFLDRDHLLDGNKLVIKGTGYEETVIIVIKKTTSNKNPYSGAVDIAVSGAAQSGEDGDFPVFYHRIFFTIESDEEYRFVVPFALPQLAMVLQTEKSTLNVSLKVD